MDSRNAPSEVIGDIEEGGVRIGDLLGKR